MYSYVHVHTNTNIMQIYSLTHAHIFVRTRICIWIGCTCTWAYVYVHVHAYAYTHFHTHTHTHTGKRKRVSGRARNTRGRASCCISPRHCSQPTILLVETVPDASWKALPAKVKCSKNAQQDAVCGIESSHGVSARLPSPWQQASHSRWGQWGTHTHHPGSCRIWPRSLWR